MPVDVTLEVTGVAEALKALAKADPELRKAVIKDMKQAAGPLVAAARALVPSGKVLTNWYGWRDGWDSATAKKGIKVTFKGGKVRGKSADHFPLLSLQQTDPGGAIYDIAGRTFPGKRSEGAARGAAMVNKLNTYGTASRTLWPAVERNFGDVEAALNEAIDTMTDVINREILKRA
jgi:hypothetical protein